MLLEELSKKDFLWREVAFRITNNKDSADELVQKMYIRMVDYNIDIKKINDNFIKVVLYNLHKTKKKKVNRTISLEGFKKFHLVTKTESSGYNDREIEVLQQLDKLSDAEKKLIQLNYDLPINQIAKINEDCRVKIHRKAIKIRKKVLKKGFEKEYKNRRLKFKK